MQVGKQAVRLVGTQRGGGGGGGRGRQATDKLVYNTHNIDCQT